MWFFDSLISMTTFTDVSVYCEVGGNWLDAAMVPESPLSISAILRNLEWKFKGGSMEEASADGRLPVTHSNAVWPDGMARAYGEAYAHAVANDWIPNRGDNESEEAVSNAKVMREYLRDRCVGRNRRVTRASLAAHVATYTMVKSCLTDYDDTLDAPAFVQGAAAVYEAAHIIVTSARIRKASDTFEADSKLNGVIRELVVTGAMASSLYGPAADEAVTAICTILANTKVAAIMACWKDIQMASADMVSGRRKAATLALGRDLLESGSAPDSAACLEMAEAGVRARAGYWETASDLAVNTAQMVAWVKVSARRVLVLGKSAMASLAQTLISYASQVVAAVADTYVEARTYSRDPAGRATIVAETMITLMDKMYEAGVNCSPGNHVKVCKSYKKAFAVYHAMIAGPCAAADIPILRDEAVSVGEVPEADLEEYWGHLAGFTAKEGHNVGKVFKVCPPPDVSPGSTMLERIRDIKDANPFVARYGDTVIKELEIQVVFARCNMPGPKPEFRDTANKPRWAGDYYRGNWSRVPIDLLPGLVAWENSLVMPERSALDPSVWKDSSLGADALDEGLSGEMDEKKGNMKTRMLFDEGVPSPEALERNTEDVVEMLIKGEGHKDPARAIFSSNIRHRFRQSTLELAVERVAAHHPAFFVGTGPEDYERVERLVTLAGFDPGFLVRYYSFDVSGWSAKMSPEIQRASRAIWSKLYGTSLFVDNFNEMETAKIYVNKSGYIGWYENNGSNLEGFDGKHLTMVNVAMLAAAVKVWRAEAVADGMCTAVEAANVRATLMAYIDDGMARIDFPASGGQAQAEACFKKFQSVSQAVFLDASFKLDPPKCFPSDVFFVFLNEAYVAGRRVMHGTRAAAAICGDPMDEHLSFPECVDKVTNACRGVVKAGADATAAAVLQAFHLYYLAGDWIRIDDAVVFARWAVVPRAMGGLGVPTQLQMGSTASGEPFAEGICTLQRLAKSTTFDAQLLVELLTAEYADNTVESTLVAPMAVHVVEGYMPTAAMSVAVRRAIEDYRDRGGTLSPIATEYLRYADPVALREYAELIVPEGGIVQEVFLEAAAESHPQKVFAQFTRSIESSRTLRNIVGWGVYHQIVNDNRMACRASWGIFKNRISSAVANIGRLII
jgi:hypothetical protein